MREAHDRDPAVAAFVAAVAEAPCLRGVFNPWRDVDGRHDIGPRAPRMRAAHLRRYLAARRGKARFLLIGEALGYQGGHFSGIPMTSERILLGLTGWKEIDPSRILPGMRPRRTSRRELGDGGFSEPTGTIVWRAVLGEGVRADEFVLWNAFPWHPYDRAKGVLSNRKPSQEELRAGSGVLAKFLELFGGAAAIAVGRVAAARLAALGVGFREVRHPAQGGAALFRRQLRGVIRPRQRRARPH